MFETFDATTENYIPNNLFVPPPEVEFKVDIENAHEIRCGDLLLGYYWEYGEDIAIPITNCIPIEISEYDLTSMVSGDAPTIQTEAQVGARFYNLVDVKSWFLVGATEEGYFWQQDEHLISFEPNVIPVEITPKMDEKSLVATFYNHWGEEVYTQQFDSVNKGTVKISLEDSKKIFVRGVYTLYVSVVSDTLTEEINKYEVQVR